MPEFLFPPKTADQGALFYFVTGETLRTRVSLGLRPEVSEALLPKAVKKKYNIKPETFFLKLNHPQ